MIHSDTPNIRALDITPRGVALSQGYCILALTLIYLVTLLLYHFYGTGTFGLKTVFNVGRDSSIPTWYASLALLFCALQSAYIALAERHSGGRRMLWWGGLALAFLFMSIDEVAMIHERIGKGASVHMLGDGYDSRVSLLYYSWVVVGGTISLIFGVVYLRFVLGLPPAIRNLFFVAATMFLAGALGVESFNGRHHKIHGMDLTYGLLTGLEELLEMAGVAIALYALVAYRQIRIDIVPTG